MGTHVHIGLADAATMQQYKNEQNAAVIDTVFVMEYTGLFVDDFTKLLVDLSGAVRVS